MIGLLLLGIIALWAVLGFFLWKWLLKPRFRSGPALALATVIAAIAWFVGPVLDEVLGAHIFKRLCDEMPQVEFYGPVAVGPGAFFDEKGNRRWMTEDDFYAIKRNAKEWTQIFGVKSEDRSLTRWPMPIFEGKTISYEKSTGRPVVVSHFRGSSGGWFRRAIGLGQYAPYQCPFKGTYPQDESTIVFDRK